LLKGLLENLPLKIMSLFLALLLWFVIAGEKTSEMGLQVPLELENFPTDLEITGDPANSIEVRLRASPGIISRLGPGEVSAHLDLAGAAEGERIVHLTESAVRVPFGVKVVKVSPAIITLNLEKTIQKSVPVRPRILGRPARGYEVGKVSSAPGDVRMAGPRSRVQDVESAFTEPVSVEGADSTVLKTANVGLEDPLLRIQGDPKVRVSVEVRPAQDKRTFDSVPVALRGGSAVSSPGVVKIVLAGPAAALKAMSVTAVRAWVNLAGLQLPKRVPVSVELEPGPPGVGLDHVEPDMVLLSPPRSRK
jgi:YbbR domain-containing protein